MKVLVTGASGMLGRDLCSVLAGKFDVVGLSRAIENNEPKHEKIELARVDVTDNKKIGTVIKRAHPDVIIHSAAISDVDFCEVNPEVALQVNFYGTINVAVCAREIGVPFIYISTDYVFDGTKEAPYVETDKTAPVNAYGRSKLEGEEYIRSHIKEYFIIRTSWLFGAGRKNFIDYTIECAKKDKKVKAISDKYACVVYTLDLSKAISDLIDKQQSGLAPYGIYHITNSGICSRYDLAKEILEYAHIEAELIPISSKDAVGKAIRPKMTALDNSKICRVLGYALRPHIEATREYLVSYYPCLR